MLRYKIDILEELKNAGYSTYRLRKDKLIAESTAQKIREGNTNIALESLGVLCNLLKCQPGDLVEWVPEE